MSRNVRSLQITSQHAQHLMRNFGERGIICFGPHLGKQPTFVLLDEWVPRPAPKDRDKALAELAKRYVTSHGPAQVTDLAGWAGINLTDARKALGLLRTKLDEIVVSGTTYYAAPSLKRAHTSEAYLLSGFDEFMLGYKDRTAALPLEHSNKIVPGGNGMFLPTIVVNGQVAGTWKKQQRAKEVALSLQPFAPLAKPTVTTPQKAVNQYGTFIGLTPRLA